MGAGAGRWRMVLVAAMVAGALTVVSNEPGAQAQSSPPPRYPAASVFRSDGVLASDPATVSMPDIGTAAFVVGTDRGIWWATRQMPWTPLGAPSPGLVGNPAVVSWGPGRIDLFVEGADHKLWQIWTDCSGCSWSAWLQPVGTDGTLASAPAVTSEGAGRIDVVVQGTDGDYYWRDWDLDGWSPGWAVLGAPSIGAVVGSIAGEQAAVTSYGPGRLDVFARGRDNELWQTFMVGGGWVGGWFQPLGALGTLAAAPAAEWWNDGGGDELSVFVQGTDAHLYQATWTGASWVPWTVEGGPADVFVGDPEVPTTVQFAPTVLVRGTDNLAYAYQPQVVVPTANAIAYAGGRQGFAAFTLVDTATGSVYSSPGADTQIRTASVIKVPIAMSLVALADSQHRGLTSTESSELDAMITQSDNNAATALWNEVGGTATVLRLMADDGATNTAADPSDPQAWGFTESTSHDLAVVLSHLAEGSPANSGIVVQLMHQVIASQAWGIGAAIPSAAIKNGWYPDPADWRVNCLGIIDGSRYSLAIMTEYPIGLGQGYGEVTCQQITADLFPTSAAVPQAAAGSAHPEEGPLQVPAITGPGMTADGG